MATVKQPTLMPTNKLTAATAVMVLMGLIEVVLETYLPNFADPRIYNGVSILLMFVIGWFVKDKPNTDIGV